MLFVVLLAVCLYFLFLLIIICLDLRIFLSFICAWGYLAAGLMLCLLLSPAVMVCVMVDWWR